MTVAKDALTTSSLASFTHTPVGTPRGVTIWIVMATATDQVTAPPTYGGVTVPEHPDSPVIAGGSEGGSCHLFHLGSGIPTGPQTVAISLGAGTARSMVQTVTAAADTEIISTGIINDADGTGGSGARTDTLALGGRVGVVGEVVWSETGGVSDLTPLVGWSVADEQDEGSETNARYTYDTVGSADVTFGFTAGAVADVVVLAAAIGEVVAGGDGRTGYLDATETGADDATAAGVVDIAGALAASETGADDATMSGAVVVQGDLDATETGSDTFAGTGDVGAAGPITGDMAAVEAGSDVFAGRGAGTGRATAPAGGSSDWLNFHRFQAELRRRREEEREELDLTEQEQRRLDRTAAKIARRVAKEGLNADRPLVMAAPSFDALLTTLRPTEGQVLALADAILRRIVWMAEAQQADEEAALMALLAEL